MPADPVLAADGKNDDEQRGISWARAIPTPRIQWFRIVGGIWHRGECGLQRQPAERCWVIGHQFGDGELVGGFGKNGPCGISVWGLLGVLRRGAGRLRGGFGPRREDSKTLGCWFRRCKGYPRCGRTGGDRERVASRCGRRRKRSAVWQRWLANAQHRRLCPASQIPFPCWPFSFKA